jgi:Fe-S cluster assembly protein SufD
MSPALVEKDVFRASFDRFAAGLAADEPVWLRSIRTAAIARFAERGFPTKKDEAWRHTNVAPIARTVFRAAEESAVQGPAASALAGLRLPEHRGAELVFVNGRHSPELSRATPDGAQVLSLRETLGGDGHRLETDLTRVSGPDQNVFADLNTAFLEDGACVFVPPRKRVAEPIHLVFLSANPAGAPTVSHPRVFVVAGRESEAQIVESYGGGDGEAYFTNAVTEVVVEDGAVLNHTKMQREGLRAFHVATLAARLGRDARFSSHAISLGGALVRDDVNVVLGDEGADCVLNGLLMVAGLQHVDTHTRIDHEKPHGSSRELYKVIVDGKSRAVFDGKIIVRKDAQKTDAQQTNKNLLLSKEALVNSTPALEILADDVKCKHGSTTGQLDEAALFYLRSRGIGEAAARSLLTYAFASDVIQRVPVDPIRTKLQRQLQSRFEGALEQKEAIA